MPLAIKMTNSENLSKLNGCGWKKRSRFSVIKKKRKEKELDAEKLRLEMEERQRDREAEMERMKLEAEKLRCGREDEAA